jgi:hypothetical protein
LCNLHMEVMVYWNILSYSVALLICFSCTFVMTPVALLHYLFAVL